MWRATSVTALLGLFLTASSFAQVYQCKDASGKVSYSDAPCATHQTSRTVEEPRSAADIQRERSQANEAIERKQRDSQTQRDQQRLDLQQQAQTRNDQQAAAPNPANSSQCAQARKELDFVTSIRTLSERDQRIRTNAAITSVNAACGTNTPLMQEPTKVIIQNDPTRQQAISR